MNVTHGETFDCYGEDPLIDIIAECLGDDAGINCDMADIAANCSISEMADLLVEIANCFHGDTAGALDAIRAGELQFEEIQQPDGLAWHICPFSSAFTNGGHRRRTRRAPMKKKSFAEELIEVACKNFAPSPARKDICIKCRMPIRSEVSGGKGACLYCVMAVPTGDRS